MKFNYQILNYVEENELENFFEWTEENTEEELFKDFIHEE